MGVWAVLDAMLLPYSRNVAFIFIFNTVIPLLNSITLSLSLSLSLSPPVRFMRPSHRLLLF